MSAGILPVISRLLDGLFLHDMFGYGVYKLLFPEMRIAVRAEILHSKPDKDLGAVWWLHIIKLPYGMDTSATVRTLLPGMVSLAIEMAWHRLVIYRLPKFNLAVLFFWLMI